jgi:branched-chain amino acid transport system permease protein
LPLQIILDSFSESAVLMLVTLAVVLIFKTSTTTNFAQGTISTMAAFFMAAFTNGKVADGTSVLSYGVLPLIISILVGIVSAFTTSLLIDKLLLRKARFKNPAGTQMITMGVVLLLTGLVSVVLSERGQYYAIPIIKGSQKIFGLNITNHAILLILLAAFIIAVIFILLQKTKWGLGVRATAANEIMADAMGVNTHSITAITWGLAGALGAVAAIFYAPIAIKENAINIATLMIIMQVDAFLALVVGGITNFYGPVVVAFFIPVTRAIIAVALSPLKLTAWANAFLYIIILLVILLFPNGVFGKKRVKKV